jgi:Tfp pilus assembly protein PilV
MEMKDMTRKTSRGIFLTISVFFLSLTLLMIATLLLDIQSSRENTNARTTDLLMIGTIRSNVEWMAKDTYAASGFTYTTFGNTLSIEENISKAGTLSRGLEGLAVFWNTNSMAKTNTTLAISSDAYLPKTMIRPMNFPLTQLPTNTSIVVPTYSNASLSGYNIILIMPCISPSGSWANLSESSAGDSLNFTLDLRCDGSDSTYSTFKQLNRSATSELHISDAGANLTTITITSPGSISIQKLQSAYLNIMMAMNESVEYEVAAMLNVSRSASSYYGPIRISGGIE